MYFKKILVLSALCFFPLEVFTQEDTEITYKTRLTKALSSFSTGNSNTSFGNFASLSTASNTLSASLYFLDKENTAMYTINASAGTAEGISTLFDEGKLNSKVTLGFEYRLLNKNSPQVTARTTSEIRDLKKDILKIRREYELKNLGLIESVLTNKTTTKNTTDLQKQLKKVDSLFTKLYDGKMSLEKERTFSDFQKNLKSKLVLIRDSITKRIEIDENNHANFSRESNYLGRKMAEKIAGVQKKIDAIKSKAIHLSFWSFGYSAKREDFKLLIDSLSFENQIKSEDYVSHTLNFSYNLASNLKGIEKNDFSKAKYARKRFFSIGAAFSYSNNLASLKQVEIVDSKVLDSTGTRVSNTKQNAFEGEYKQDVNSVNLFLDYYSFLKIDENSIALHLNPEVKIADFQKPVSSFQFGVLIPFKKKDDQKTTINVEIFYKLKDIFNTTDNSNSILNRNQIGFQTTFPFNF